MRRFGNGYGMIYNHSSKFVRVVSNANPQNQKIVRPPLKTIKKAGEAPIGYINIPVGERNIKPYTNNF